MCSSLYCMRLQTQERISWLASLTYNFPQPLHVHIFRQIIASDRTPDCISTSNERTKTKPATPYSNSTKPPTQNNPPRTPLPPHHPPPTNIRLPLTPPKTPPTPPPPMLIIIIQIPIMSRIPSMILQHSRLVHLHRRRIPRIIRITTSWPQEPKRASDEMSAVRVVVDGVVAVLEAAVGAFIVEVG